MPKTNVKKNRSLERTDYELGNCSKNGNSPKRSRKEGTSSEAQDITCFPVIHQDDIPIDESQTQEWFPRASRLLLKPQWIFVDLDWIL